MPLFLVVLQLYIIAKASEISGEIMLTLKFGGTSMGSARRILDSADIMAGRAQKDRISVIVSAVAGVSNKLEESIAKCLGGAQGAAFVEQIRSVHSEIVSEIQSTLPNFNAKAVNEKIEASLQEYQKLLDAVATFGECPTSIHCRVMGLGELMSSPIVEAVLQAKGLSVLLLDSRKFLFTTGNQKEGDPDYKKTSDALSGYRDGESREQPQILLFPGFICTWTDKMTGKNAMGLMGRNGSDFSASVIGSCLGASKVEFWTDVDGIYTADPRIVKDAILVRDMSYEETIELSFFGSKVLHPKTLAPLAAKNIEAWSLNSMNPSARGTRIARGPFANQDGADCVTGISCLKNTAMISVSGNGMKGKTGTASRIFAAVSRAGCSMLLITQSSSEYTISFCVKEDCADLVKETLSAEFDLEIREKIINPIDVHKDCAIVSIVGDRMKQRRGVASTFFDALASRDINILAIAQGASERSISAVINKEDGDTAVRIAHSFFFNTAQTIQVFAFWRCAHRPNPRPAEKSCRAENQRAGYGAGKHRRYAHGLKRLGFGKLAGRHRKIASQEQSGRDFEICERNKAAQSDFRGLHSKLRFARAVFGHFESWYAHRNAEQTRKLDEYGFLQKAPKDCQQRQSPLPLRNKRGRGLADYRHAAESVQIGR